MEINIELRGPPSARLDKSRSTGYTGRTVVNSLERHVFRITHIDNVPWILQHGLHANSSAVRDPNFVSIGNPDLISRRSGRVVPVEPGGTLDDYVPFYFCTRSVMLYKIHTGQVEGVNVRQEDIVYLVSRVERIRDSKVDFVFTDRNAYIKTASYFDDPSLLEPTLDWRVIDGTDFRHDKDDPSKPERRMAELLIHRHLPIQGLLGLACIDMTCCMKLTELVKTCNPRLHVASRPGWYFE